MNPTQAKPSIPAAPLSGAAMDAPLHRPRRWRLPAFAAAVALLLLSAWGWRQLMPRGLQVPIEQLRIAIVESGEFRDDVVLRAHTAALSAVMLDSTESGRVEEVLARDGMEVSQGELLFRLSNPQRHLDLLARQSEHAQQISNLSNLQVALEASRAEHQRRRSELAYAQEQAEKQHRRNAALATQGFLSGAHLEESSDLLAQRRHLLAEAHSASVTDLAIRKDVVQQLKRAIDGLETGLRLVNATVASLSVRAPVAGRLTDFNLQVGQTVRPDQHIGRIDDPRRYKLTAQVDEYYLARVTPGRRGSVRIGGRAYALEVSRVFPQIKDGRFVVELVFGENQPLSLRPGQGADVTITLGEASKTLVLPTDAFLTDGGGAFAYVLAADGQGATRRPIRVGRRSNSQVELLDGIAAGDKVVISGYARFGQAEQLLFLQSVP